MSFGDVLIIVLIVVAIIVGVVYYIGRKNYGKNLEAQAFISQYKQVTPILVIDKKFEKPSLDNLPKNIYDKFPKTARIRKMPIVKAKVGSQITTLLCDKNIYDNLPTKKTIKVELAGIYISNIVGLNLEDKKNKTWREKLSLWIKDTQNKANMNK